MSESPLTFEEMKKLNNTVSKGDYSESIVHYTSESSLTKIIASNELWLGRIDQMNDATEFTHFAEAVRLVAYRLVPEAPKDIVDMLLGAFEKQMKNATYISSWCEYQDDAPEGRLPMWIAYGDKAGGVAVVVDSTQMQPSNITPSKFDYFVFTSQVEYVHRNDVESTANNLLERIRASHVLQRIPNSEIILGGILMARAPTSKHQTFREEKEIRFLIMPDFLKEANRFCPENRIRNSNGREFFSLELKNWSDYDLDLRLSNILKKILVGPRNNPE